MLVWSRCGLCHVASAANRGLLGMLTPDRKHPRGRNQKRRESDPRKISIDQRFDYPWMQARSGKCVVRRPTSADQCLEWIKEHVAL